MSTIVYNKRCEPEMKKYDDNFFDLAIVDPPYGINIAKRSGSIGQKKGQGKITNYKKKDWDSAIPDKDYFDELFRISKHQIIFGGNYFAPYLPPSKGWIVWDKRQPEGVSFAMAELAFSSIDKSVKMFSCSRALIGNKISNNAKLAKVQAKIHPTQKPILIYEWILKNYAQPGWKILDTHVGSGSSRIACFNNGFPFVGYEADEDHFNDAENRFALEISQPKLFEGFHNLI